MKLIKSGKNTLRISLSPEDLELLEVRLEDFDYDLPKGRRIIKELFERAKKETGFEANREKVYIQLYPKNDGGCELFIIKLEAEAEGECFFFSSFDAFFPARKLFREESGITCYRLRDQELFLILSPSLQVPPRLTEYGQRLKRPPSPLFLKSRCQKI